MRGFAELTRRALDFDKGERMKVLTEFYNNANRQTMERLLADGFVMGGDGDSKTYSKAEYIGLLSDLVLPSIPDFAWTAATNADTDDDGYAIVTVQAAGHHTGKPFALPGLPPVAPTGNHFCLAEKIQKVLVADHKIQKILVLPSKGAGPLALYQALGGSLPVDQVLPAAASAGPPVP